MLLQDISFNELFFDLIYQKVCLILSKKRVIKEKSSIIY